MDIHRKSVDMDMYMDVKFHIHGNPDNTSITKKAKPVLSVATPLIIIIYDMMKLILWAAWLAADGVVYRQE